MCAICGTDLEQPEPQAWSGVQSCKGGSSTHPRISQKSPISELGKRTRQEVLDLRPGEPRFGAVGLPAVVDDTELEEPARSEQLHALQGFAVDASYSCTNGFSRGGP
jgi:hypothetical protein